MSTLAGAILSFLRFQARRRDPARRPADPASPEPLGPGLGTLVRGHRARPVPPPAMQPEMPARRAPVPRVPPEPTTLARTLPDVSLLTPEATVPTVLVPIMAEQAPTTAVPGLAVPDEGAETTIRPRRND